MIDSISPSTTIVRVFVRPKRPVDGGPLKEELITVALPPHDDLPRWLEDVTQELRSCTPRGTVTFPRAAPLSPTADAVAAYGISTNVWPVAAVRLKEVRKGGILYEL